MDTNREGEKEWSDWRSDIEGEGAQGSAEQGGSRANFKTTDNADDADILRMTNYKWPVVKLYP